MNNTLLKPTNEPTQMSLNKSIEKLSGNGNNTSTNASQPFVRMGIIVVLIGFIGFLLWAALAPLDEGVTAMGTVGVESKRKTVQHLNGGIIQDILVKDGDIVKKGQTLLRLDQVQLEAQRLITLKQLISTKALQMRLIAERTNASKPDFSQTVLKDKTNQSVLDAVNIQTALFKTNRQTIDSQLSILDTTIEGLKQQIKGLESLQDSKAEQAKLLKEELDSLRTLFKKGYVPRNRIFELERSIAEISAQRSSDLADIERARASLSEYALKKQQIKQEFYKDTENKLAEAQNDVSGLEEKMTAIDDELSRTDIQAPEDGIVVGLNAHTIGGVIRPGEPILDLVPKGDALIVEAKIMPRLIETVNIGLPALVRFVALERTNPVLQGKIVSVSADVLTDKQSGASYYSARISIPQEEMMKLNSERIIPGMPVDVVIKTGERSLLAYLLKPLMDHVFNALRER